MSGKDTTGTLARQTPQEPQVLGPVVDKAVAGIITTVDLLVARTRELSRVANVISPFGQTPSHLAAGFAVSIVPIVLDPTVDNFGNGGDCYRGGFMKQDQRAIARVGLRKLAHALAIDWLPFPYCRRVDDGAKAHYAEYTCEGVYRSFDASPQKVRGTSCIDFRDGSDQIGGWTAAKWADLMEKNKAAMRGGATKESLDWQIGGWSEQRVRAARQKVLERAETGGQNRAIRDFGLKHVYTLDELKKPFVCFRMTFVPDMNDPDVRRTVTIHNLGSVAMLYPHAAAGPVAALPPAPVTEDDPPAGRESDTAGSPPASDASSPASTATSTASSSGPATPAAPPPPADDRKARRVVTVGERKEGGAFVVLDGGEYLLADADLAAAAVNVRAADRAVFVEVEARGADRWLVELEFAPAGSSTPAPPVDDDRERVATVEERPGKTGDRAWILYRIKTTAGKLLTTFDAQLAATARHACARRLPIRYEAPPSQKYPEQFDLKSIRVDDGSEPDLPFEADRE